jgi:hypothetical protein
MHDFASAMWPIIRQGQAHHQLFDCGGPRPKWHVSLYQNDYANDRDRWRPAGASCLNAHQSGIMINNRSTIIGPQY